MTVMRFKELDVVSLRLAQGGLTAGAVGTVLEVFEGKEPEYLVEFDYEDGSTQAVSVIKESALQAWTPPHQTAA
jgi:hypothetical protein